MAAFLLLEILDPDVNAFLADVATVVKGVRPKKPFHITLRGPYARSVPKATIDRCRRALARDVLRIGGVGRFSNASEEVAYLRVDSPGLREVWWKPEYPIGTFGFEPHLSVYRGPNALLADRIVGVLEAAQIDLLCAETRVAVYRSGHRQLPLSPTAGHGGFHRLAKAGRVSPLFFEELQRAISSVGEQEPDPRDNASGIEHHGGAARGGQRRRAGGPARS